MKNDQGSQQAPPTSNNRTQDTAPPPRIKYLQQAIAYVAEGRGDLVPVVYLHFIAGMVDGALSRRRRAA